MDFYFPPIRVHLRGIFEPCFSHVQWELGILPAPRGTEAALTPARERWVGLGEGSHPVRPSLSLSLECPLVRIFKIFAWPWASSLSP